MSLTLPSDTNRASFFLAELVPVATPALISLSSHWVRSLSIHELEDIDKKNATPALLSPRH
jgi:hypothetical protein